VVQFEIHRAGIRFGPEGNLGYEETGIGNHARGEWYLHRLSHWLLSGNPDPDYISTSFIERQNLTMRMGMRRFTRLTNWFSKKLENHGHAVAHHYMHYNFIRIHKTLRVTPAMQAGITDHVWSFEELLAVLDRKTEAARA
jgi:hypothetical protein